MSEGTVPVVRSGMPVRRIRVEVVSGPDAGTARTTETDQLTIGSAEDNDLVLSDRTVSRYHLELGRRGNRIVVTDTGSTNGTAAGPVVVRGGSVEVKSGTELGLGQSKLRVDDGEVVMVEHGPDRLGELRGRAPSMRRLMSVVQRAAQSDVPVLVHGESGTGKELIGRALHELGPRANEPFVVVDCGALAPTLFASELFGHERGAFTGADRQHAGAFERADGGTVFLDEIGELPAELQAALLGVLERKRIQRVGGKTELPIDVRVVCATHRDLRAEVNQNRFRLDLFYRLAVVKLQVPPLRERAEDVPLLIEHFLQEAGHDGDASALFDREALAQLKAHPWPGNVRELRNIVLGTLALGTPIELDGAPSGAGGAGGAAGDPIATALELPYKQARRRVADDFERRYIEALLARTDGNVRAAAREASMNRSYLMELMKRHGFR